MRTFTDRMSYSIFAVLVGGILLSQAIALGLYRSDRADAVAAAQRGQLASCLAGIAATIEDQPQAFRNALLANLKNRDFRVDVGGTTRDVTLDIYERPVAGALPHTAMVTVPPFGTIAMAPPERESLSAGRRLNDGTYIAVHAPIGGSDALSEPGFLASLAGSAAVAILLSAWVLGFTTRPLRRFAAAADRLGVDMNAPSLDESGPREVRLAAAAFNKMQRRLRAFVEDRTRMLAAVSHDLRTPLTRMRLRAEFVDDDTQREKILEDLGEMEAMIGATLAFARDEAAQETPAQVDVRALVDRVAENFRDAGRDVRVVDGGNPDRPAPPARLEPPTRLEPPARLEPIVGRRMALKRALDNLVENAVKYGERAVIGVTQDGDTVTVTVDDDGPGIPESEMDHVFRPFYRVEGSRSRDTGGIGLGLSVANDVVRAHGGEILLVNRPQGGLRAVVTLPCTRGAI